MSNACSWCCVGTWVSILIRIAGPSRTERPVHVADDGVPQHGARRRARDLLSVARGR